MGIVYEFDDSLHVYRSMDDFDGFMETYEFAEDNDCPMLLHFRLSTVGEVNKDNVQPLAVSEDIVFAHNGTLRGFSTPYYRRDEDERSDSRKYRDEVLKHLPEGWYKQDAILDMMEREIGYTNKFAFYVLGYGFVIINNQSGTEIGDIWFSNTLFNKGLLNKSEDEEEDKDSYEETEESSTVISSEVCFAGAWYANDTPYEIMCWDCIPNSASEDEVFPVYESIKEKYCTRCGRNLSNKETRNVAQRNSGGFNHPLSRNA